MLLHDSSMKGRERRYNIAHRLNDLTSVLHRPVETATQTGLFWPIDLMPKIHPNAAAEVLLLAAHYALHLPGCCRMK
jgi:hypothetical protein